MKSLFSRRELLTAFAAAPLLAMQEKEPFTITDNVRLVLLDVSVTNKSGSYVNGLNKGDFKILDSGKPTLITQFSNVEVPVTVGLILDDSGSMRNNRPGVVLAGLAFAKVSNPHDEFFVVNFNDRVIAGLPSQRLFTDNITELQKALYMGDPIGKTKLYDAIAYGLRHLEEGHHEKRTLIVVSDGGDNASKVSQREVISLIEQSRATIYTIGLLDSSDGDLQPQILRRFASISGGEYFQPRKSDEVIEVLYKISKDIRSRYSIGFTPETGQAARSRHSIKVIATHDGAKLNVKTRSFYSA
jgi:Ca-activated chloride channel homolog